MTETEIVLLGGAWAVIVMVCVVLVMVWRSDLLLCGESDDH
jgi:hypothetical protein